MFLRSVVLSALCAAFSAAPVSGQAFDFDAVEFTTTDLGDGLYMLSGLGGNIGMSVGEDGVFLIDDEFAQLTPKLLAAVAAVTEQPIHYVINTHWHGDHTGGNARLGDAGAVIVAHDNVRSRLAADGSQQSPQSGLPIITFSDTTTFFFNGHEIRAFHPGPAHTDGDAIIHFRDADVIHAGDILWTGYFPRVDLDSGGSLDGTIAGLERIASMAGPQTRVIAGHGPLASKAHVEEAIAMLVDVKSRIAGLIDQGMSLEEIQSSDPLADYNPAWGAFFITGEQMVEMLHRSLTQ